METSGTFHEQLKRWRVQSTLTAEAIAKKIHVSRSQYSNVERGVRQLSKAQVETLDQFYEADSELLRAWEIDNVRRRELFVMAGSAALSGVVDGMRLPVIPPSRVTPDDIAQIDVVASAFVTWDNAFGGGQALMAGSSQLDWALALLRAKCDRELRPLLFAAVGRLSSLAGFMAFDAFAHARARALFTFGLDCAKPDRRLASTRHDPLVDGAAVGLVRETT